MDSCNIAGYYNLAIINMIYLNALKNALKNNKKIELLK
ncbi:Hypothetical cytosolic protein [Lactobacillus helveticus H10]|jgi:hypothetical protein|nr:Hypothetical cytosolic protein [Lactobacillus helveticus H10]